MDQDIVIQDLDSFSAEVPLYGSSSRPDGTCTNASPFKLGDEQYDSNWIIGTVKGRVTKRPIQFDPTENIISLEGKPVHLRKNSYEGDLGTYMWSITPGTCESAIQEVYRGPAKYIVPKNPNLHKQIIVHDEARSITFALDLSGTKTICGSEFYKTQISSLHVTFKVENFLKGVEHSSFVDRLDNVVNIFYLFT